MKKVVEFLFLTLVFVLMIVGFIATLQIFKVLIEYQTITTPILFIIVILMIRKEFQNYFNNL